MSKKVKIKVAYRTDEENISVYGVPCVNTEDGLVAEVDEDLAKEMVELGRAELFKAPKEAPAAPVKKKDEPDFASDEAGELHATLVKDKKLTPAEYKKIEGTGDNGALTVGDLEDYVASKEPPAAPAPVTPPAPAKAAAK